MRPNAARYATLGTVVASGVLLAGVVVLLVAALGELSAGPPAISLVDAYWVGRLPWTPIGVGMVLFGGTATVVIGTLVAWLARGWLPRLVALVAVLATALWWATSPLVGLGGACCGPPPPYDPITLAYSAPERVLVLIVVPALLVLGTLLVPAAIPSRGAAAREAA